MNRNTHYRIYRINRVVDLNYYYRSAKYTNSLAYHFKSCGNHVEKACPVLCTVALLLCKLRCVSEIKASSVEKSIVDTWDYKSCTKMSRQGTCIFVRLQQQFITRSGKKYLKVSTKVFDACAPLRNVVEKQCCQARTRMCSDVVKNKGSWTGNSNLRH